MPHITLAQWGVTRGSLPPILRLLGGRLVSWRVPLTNLAYVASESDAPDTRYYVRSRYEVAGS